MAAFRYKTLLPLLGMFVITEWLDSTPKVLRAFGFAIYFTALTIYLEELMPFQHFFMELTIAGIIRNGPVASLMGGVYSYSMRHQVAENLSRGIGLDPTQALLVSIKQLYGITCILGVAFVLILLLWHVQPVRSTMKKMPSWHKVAHMVKNYNWAKLT